METVSYFSIRPHGRQPLLGRGRRGDVDGRGAGRGHLRQPCGGLGVDLAVDGERQFVHHHAGRDHVVGQELCEVVADRLCRVGGVHGVLVHALVCGLSGGDAAADEEVRRGSRGDARFGEQVVQAPGGRQRVAGLRGGAGRHEAHVPGALQVVQQRAEHDVVPLFLARPGHRADADRGPVVDALVDGDDVPALHHLLAERLQDAPDAGHQVGGGFVVEPDAGVGCWAERRQVGAEPVGPGLEFVEGEVASGGGDLDVVGSGPHLVVRQTAQRRVLEEHS
ncbi:hypothetical protein ACFYY3_05900 [Streptomyces sp. NPDC001812]|uniref:hypothetical protein n=1 Tax=Streptomyces sp. NPDC001812 TaxID=3364611 RepID=UPI0036CA0E79